MSELASESILEVQGLGVSFGGIRALESIDFTVKKGSITAIIGPNGAGKTTVFNCVTGFYKANLGEIFFHDQGRKFRIRTLLGESFHISDVAKLGRVFEKLRYKMFGGSHQLASLGIARTFQNIRLFKEMTAMENLLVAQHRNLHRGLLGGIFKSKSFKESEKKAIERAQKWLEIVNLTAEANRPAGQLPYGHQRRLEIARAMCSDAKLICLDEPAAGLNSQETAELAALVQRLRNEFAVTVLVIEHDMPFVMGISEHIVVLDHGVVIASGTPAEVRSNPKVLEAYLGQEGDD